MIAVDTSSLIAYFQGENGQDIEEIHFSMGSKRLLLPPVVQTEILSDYKLTPSFRTLVETLPIVDLTVGFWKRAGETRRTLLKNKLRAKLGDTLIAQSCLDHDLQLITRDSDFKKMAKWIPLKVICNFEGRES